MELKKIRVLLAEDHTIVRQGIVALLGAESDIEVVGEASNGLEAIELAKKLSPEVILMDEPCSALDPIATLKIEDLMQELKQKYTIVIVTHNMQQAARVSDETVFLYHGEVIEADKTPTIFENPSKELTSEYLTGRFG